MPGVTAHGAQALIVLPERFSGRITALETMQTSGGDPLCVLTLEQDPDVDPLQVIVSDRGILRQLGLVEGGPEVYPPRGRFVDLEVALTSGGNLVATSLEAPRHSMIRRHLAPLNHASIVVSVARVGARMAAASCLGLMRAANKRTSATRRAAQSAEAAFQDYVRVRSRGLGPESERHVLEASLRATAAALASAVRAEPNPSAPEVRMLKRALAKAERTVEALRRSVLEAATGVTEVRRSAAVEALVWEPQVRQQAAASIAWAAYQAIRTENPRGLHDGHLETIKAALSRAFLPGYQHGIEIADAMRTAYRALSLISYDISRNPIRSEEIAAVRDNVAAGLEWLGVAVPDLDVLEVGRRESEVRRHADVALGRIIEHQQERGNRMINLERGADPNTLAVAQFADGRRAFLLRNQVIRVVDADDHLVLLQLPGRPPRHYVDGKVVDEHALEAAIERAEYGAVNWL